MPKQVQAGHLVTLAELNATKASEKSPRSQARLAAIEMALKGASSAAIRGQVGIGRQRLFDLMRLCRTKGLAAALAFRHAGGRQPRISGQLLEETKARFAKREPDKVVLAWLESEGVNLIAKRQDSEGKVAGPMDWIWCWKNGPGQKSRVDWRKT